MIWIVLALGLYAVYANVLVGRYRAEAVVLRTDNARLSASLKHAHQEREAYVEAAQFSAKAAEEAERALAAYRERQSARGRKAWVTRKKNTEAA